MNLVHRLGDWMDRPHPVDALIGGGGAGGDLERVSEAEQRRQAWLRGDDVYDGGFSAGELVNDLTAFGVGPFYACVKGLSDGGSVLDCNVWYDNGDPVPPPLLPAWATRRPIYGLTEWQFWKRYFTGGMTRGLAALEIVRRNPETNLPDVLRPLPVGYRFLQLTNGGMGPGSQVRGEGEPAIVRYTPGWERGGEAYREFVEWMGPGDDEGTCIVPRYDDDGSLEGRSVLKAAHRVIGLALATAGHAELFHLTGGRPLWIVGTPVGTGDAAQKQLGGQIQQIRGNKLNRFMMLLMEGDLTVKELTSTAKESQLVEARELVVGEICRLFNYPAQLMGSQSSTAWTTGMAELKRTVLNFALRPWLRWASDALTWTLPEGMTARFNMADAQKGDPEKAAETAALMVSTGIWTVNEGREYTEKRPIQGFDELVKMPESAAQELVTAE